jgi:hypothetical protein
VSLRTLLWLLAALALAVAAVMAYSPRLGRHATPVAYAALSLFIFGWLARGSIVDAD